MSGYPPRKVVTRSKMSGTAHTIHLILTIFTLGVWSPIWFLHWLFTRNKQVTYYQ